VTAVLFHPGARFRGLPREGFDVFGIHNHDERRKQIIEAIHPALGLLAEDLLDRLNPRASEPLHHHLPRLDWPRGYRPFCTWLALSRETHGYQAGPQLNVGVHPDHVSLRLGWDTSAHAFGRFEFLSRHGEIGEELGRAASGHGLAFRVFAAAPWPQGSTCVFESASDVRGSFDEVSRRGVWWELGRRHEVPGELDFVCSSELGREAVDVLGALLPVYERIAGTVPELPGD
jgi:hypothetical protein